MVTFSITPQDFNWSEAGGGMVHGAVPEFRAPGLGLGTTSLLKFVTTHWRGFKVRLKINIHNFSAALRTL